MLTSCAPVNNIYSIDNGKLDKSSTQNEIIADDEITEYIISETPKENKKSIVKKFDFEIQNTVNIIFSKEEDPKIISQFINVIELAVYEQKLDNINFEIHFYNEQDELIDLLEKTNLSGRIFIGPLNTPDTKLLNKYCEEGVIFFSFSSDKNLANECVYLINFFPENEIRTLFGFFPDNSKIAILYPENSYGFGINNIIDKIANQSNSIIVNRASYNENLSDAPIAIKELGKYELRKYELNRQKKILASKTDNESKKRLSKLEKFQTVQDLDFTHVIIADYGLRLLQVAPLLPYYDIDPNNVQFVGTGAWDDEVFYDEPSLSGSIYPGIEYRNRQELDKNFYELYNERLLRISTLPYDLVGLIDFVINSNHTISSFYKLLNENNTKFSGVDGSFYFLNNSIERDLDILKIEKGEVKLISK